MNKKQLPQLFLLHFAGGSKYSFVFLKKYLEPFFDLVFLELPGRGSRMDEALIKDRTLAVLDQLMQFNKYRNSSLPFIIYGHSMGAVIGFEMAKLLEKTEQKAICLIFSGHPGPGLSVSEPRFNLEKIDFISVLKKLGGMPLEFLENDELFIFFEPILRADFEIVEKDIINIGYQKVNCSIFCVMGEDEKNVENINNWKNYTFSEFKAEIFKGNHFFINTQSEKLSKFIIKAYHDSVVF